MAVRFSHAFCTVILTDSDSGRIGAAVELEPTLEWVADESDDDDAERSIPSDLSDLISDVSL